MASQRLVLEHRPVSVVRLRHPVQCQIAEFGYARVSTAKQDLLRQIEPLAETGLARERIYVDKKSGATVERPGNVADPIKVDSSRPDDPMAQLAMVLLALFAQIERTSRWSAPRTPARSRRPTLADRLIARRRR